MFFQFIPNTIPTIQPDFRPGALMGALMSPPEDEPDPTVTLFRALRYFWERDADGRPLLALLCAYARDAVLRTSALFIVETRIGAEIFREDLEAFVDGLEPGRFSSNDDMVKTIRQILTRNKKLPLTLVILDEIQHFRSCRRTTTDLSKRSIVEGPGNGSCF